MAAFDELVDLDVNNVEEEFNRAAEYLQTIVSDLDQGTLLEIYGLYKQGTVGDCNIPKPGIFSIQAKAKWNAWNSRRGLTRDTAMSAYVEQISKINPLWDEQYQQSGSAGKPKSQQWVSVSQHQLGDPVDNTSVAECDKTSFDFVKEGRPDQLIRTLESTRNDVNQLDESGLGLIHWAADRGNSDVLFAILSHGCNVDLQDSDGQTALHYATCIGHVECVKLLIKFNADRSILDSDSQTCTDVASDAVILNLLAE